MSSEEIVEISNICSSNSPGLSGDEMAEKDTRYPFRHLSQPDSGSDFTAQKEAGPLPTKAPARLDLPLAQWPVALNDGELNTLAVAVRWQGPLVKAWIDARTEAYVVGGQWTGRQCRITAGIDWELVRLAKHLGLNLQKRTASIRAYFEMHRNIDAVCAWIESRNQQNRKDVQTS